MHKLLYLFFVVMMLTFNMGCQSKSSPSPRKKSLSGNAFGETIKMIKQRGKVVCGVNAHLPGFGYLDKTGKFSGFDIDFCHAIAAAIFNNTDNIEFRPLTAKERFANAMSRPFNK